MNSFLAITYAFSLAFMPYYDISACQKTADDSDAVKFENLTWVEYELGLDICNTFRLYTGETTKQIPDGGLYGVTSWFPVQQAYYLGGELHHSFKYCDLKIGVKHECTHPVQCWDERKTHVNEAYTKIYVGASGRVDFF